MKKIIVSICLFSLCCVVQAQDVGCNYLPFDKDKDTIQVSFGFRFGSIKLSQDSHDKSYNPQDPKKIGLGNFILDMRTRLYRDSISSHDGALGLNMSLFRSRAFVGYQYSRGEWYGSVRFGYEVYRKHNGEMRAHTKLFSENVPMVGFEFGYLPNFLNQMFRLRALVEHDFRHFGLYASGTCTARIFEWNTKRVEFGVHFDGIFGYGFFSSICLKNTLFYVSTFENQLTFQETRFPEQKKGMDKGFSFGLQHSFR